MRTEYVMHCSVPTCYLNIGTVAGRPEPCVYLDRAKAFERKTAHEARFNALGHQVEITERTATR